MPPRRKKAKRVNNKAANEDPDFSADSDEDEDFTRKRKKPVVLVQKQTSGLEHTDRQLINEPSELINEPSELINEPSELINESSEFINEPSELINEPSELINEPSELINVPSGLGHTLRQLINVPLGLGNTHRQTINVPSGLGHTRRQPINVPSGLGHTRRQPINVPSGLGLTNRQPINVPSGLGHTRRQLINVPSEPDHTCKQLKNVPSGLRHTDRQLINVPSGTDHTYEQLINVPPGPEHTYLKKLLLFILLVISILISYSIYNNMNTEIQTLQLHTHNLQGKVNQLETVSNEKFSSLLGDTKTYTASVEKMSKIEEMVKNTSNTANAIDLFFQSKIKEFEVLEKEIVKINEKLKKEKSDLDFMVEEIGEVKKERGEIEMVKKLAESCLALHNNLTFEIKNITEMTTKMEKLSKYSSFLRQEHNRFSQKLQEFDTKLTEKNNLLNTRISTINSDLGTESLRLNKLKLLLDTLQEKQGDISTMESKLDKAQQSVSHIEKDLIKHDEKIEKYQKEFPSISKIPKRVQTLDETVEKISKDIEDKWVLVQIITVAFVITVFSVFGGLFYSRTQIGNMEKKIRYLTENKDKPALQYESLSIVDQIKRRQPEELENKFCVISFNQETHNKHRKITRPSVEGRLRIKKMDEADFVVTNDKSVLKIPHYKVILVFVDHNQKDVILETPGEDEEDIKLLTVQACRKMGADVFVIYVGDEGSESLMAGCLYNPQLTTVAEHFELKQLEQRNRVITCHEKFTITQREKVAQAIA